MATNPPADLELAPLRGEPHTVSEWVGMFHLLTVAVDPFNERSAWLVETFRSAQFMRRSVALRRKAT